MKRFVCWSCCAVIVIIGQTAGMAGLITWGNPLGGAWTTAVNWSPNQVPTNGDDIVVGAVGGQTAGYEVTWDFSNPAMTYSSLTIGDTTSGNGYTEGVKFTATYGNLPTFTNITINNDGYLWIADRRVWLASGAVVTNNGTIYGHSAYGTGKGFYAAGGSVQPIIRNRGTISIRAKGGDGLDLSGIEFDNIGQTVTLTNGEHLYMQDATWNPQFYGGTINIETGGWASCASQGNTWGRSNVVDGSIDAVVINVKTGGYFQTGSNSGKLHYFSVTNHGEVSQSYGALLGAWSNGVIRNHGKWTNGRALTWAGAIVNEAGGKWLGQGYYGAGVSLVGAGVFTNNGTISLGDNSPSNNSSAYQGGRWINNGTFEMSNVVFSPVNLGIYQTPDVFINNGAFVKTNALQSDMAFDRWTNNNVMVWNGLMKIPYASGLINNSALTMKSASRITSSGGGGRGFIKNASAGSVITMEGSDFGDTWGLAPVGGEDFAYICQSDGSAVIQGTGAINVDFFATNATDAAYSPPLGSGSLIGTLKASGGTLIVTNMTAAPAGKTQTHYNNAHTLTVTTAGKLVATNGALVCTNFSAAMPINGELQLLDVGLMSVNTSVVFGANSVTTFGLKDAGGANSRLDVGGHLTLAGTLNIVDSGGFRGGSFKIMTYQGTLGGSIAIGSYPNPSKFNPPVLRTSTPGEIWFDITPISGTMIMMR